jgi:hypothetical protein
VGRNHGFADPALAVNRDLPHCLPPELKGTFTGRPPFLMEPPRMLLN